MASGWAFSNFTSCDVEMDGLTYSSVEHAYQAAKTLNLTERTMIANQNTAGQAKRAGYKVTLRSDWEEVKIGVMEELLRQKYAEGTDFRAILDATGDKEIVEWNVWHDTFWGKCNCVNHESRGLNVLGTLLMDIRDGKRRSLKVCTTHNHIGEDTCFYCKAESGSKDRIEKERKIIAEQYEQYRKERDMRRWF